MSKDSKPARVTTWCADEEAGAPLLQALAAHCDLDQLEALPDPGASKPEGTLLLLPSAPTRALCRAMFAGSTPAEASAQWQAQARQILALVRRDRRHTRVVEIEAALAHPGAFCKFLDLPREAAPAAEGHDSRYDPLLSTLAQNLLLADPQNRRLLRELDAARANLSGTPPTGPVDPEDAYWAWHSHHDAREALEALQVRVRELEAETTAAAGLRERAREKEQSLEAADRLIRQLELKNNMIQSELDQARAEAEHFKAELHRHQNSHSYRLTAPLRRLRALLSRVKPA